MTSLRLSLLLAILVMVPVVDGAVLSKPHSRCRSGSEDITERRHGFSH